MVEGTESDPVLCHPDEPEMYSHTKALAERPVLSANREHGMLTGSIRPATLHGVGDEFMTGNVTKQALTGRANIRFGTGPYLFDITHVGHCTYAQVLLAQALVEAAQPTPLAEDIKVEGEAFVVTIDEYIPFWDLPRLVAELVGCLVKDKNVRCIPIWLIFVIAMINARTHWVFSLGRKQPQLTPRLVRVVTMERTLCIDKIKTRLGYKPKFTNKESWDKAVEWSLPKLKHLKTLTGA